MVVSREYMLKKRSGPSAPKLFLDQRVVPFATNLAGSFEGLLERVSVRSGLRPALILAGGAGVLSLALVSLLRRRRNEFLNE